MKAYGKRIAALAVAAGLLLAGCGGSGDPHGIPSGAVAAVAGKGITQAEVDHWIAVHVRSSSVGTPFEHGAVAPDPPTYSQCIAHLEVLARRARHGHSASRSDLLAICARQRALFVKEAVTALISDRWERAEGEARGVSVTPGEVAAQLESERKLHYATRAALEADLARHGETLAELREHVERELITEHLQQRIDAGKGQVTASEVRSYYEKHRSEFGPSTAANLRVILTHHRSEAEDAARELRAGTPFAQVASRRSISQTRHAGGVFDGLEPGQAPEALEHAVFSARPNVLGGPIKSFVGWWLYEVISVTHHGAQTLAAATPLITEHLHDEKASALNRGYAAALVKRWTAKTECRPSYVVEHCKEYAAARGGRASTATSASVPANTTP
jgi:parvulin-like peptidyl-prolyl isomerase